MILIASWVLGDGVMGACFVKRNKLFTGTRRDSRKEG